MKSFKTSAEPYGLAEIAKELPSLLREAEARGWIYYEFIHEILSHEMACRERIVKN